MAQTVKQWEEKAAEAGRWDVRTAFCRFGIILEKNDGALPRMALPYKLFAGGNLGSGNWIPAPAFALKLALGEMSKLVLEGQRVLPAKLEAAGFSFRYPGLEEALKDIY
ncbi:Epimerase family protein SA0724 [Mycobacteroides abscessus subsp. abscessus]|nr:Epimerase family protein SA0724 [Mycobacteroides abscessus subsp. abscessus]